MLTSLVRCAPAAVAFVRPCTILATVIGCTGTPSLDYNQSSWRHGWTELCAPDDLPPATSASDERLQMCYGLASAGSVGFFGFEGRATSTFHYDADGRLLEVEAELGLEEPQWIRIDRDTEGRIASFTEDALTIPDVGFFEMVSFSWTYDESGRAVQLTEHREGREDKIRTLTYDADGRLFQVVIADPFDMEMTTTTRIYDGDLVTRVERVSDFETGCDGPCINSTAYEYDSYGHLALMQADGEYEIASMGSYRDFAQGSIALIWEGDLLVRSHLVTPGPSFDTVYEYDSGRLVMRRRDDVDGNLVNVTHWTYDSAGRVRSIDFEGHRGLSTYLGD